MTTVSGRAPSGQALFSDQAPVGLDPSGFDPSRCQWCGDTGFDLKGLAHHVRDRCEVVDELADQNIDDVMEWHRQNRESLQARNAIAIEAASAGETEGLDTKCESAGPEGIAQ